MMQAEDIAGLILACLVMPARTLVEEVYMSPAIQRDISLDIRAGLQAKRSNKDALT
jgi:hypothetical protein